MADPASAKIGGKIIEIIWTNRKSIQSALKKIRAWMGKDIGGRIVILGPGGTGKDTLAKILASEGIPVTLDLSKYEESSDVETYRLKRKKGKDVEVVVMPGQRHRRESTWAEFLQKVTAGDIRGVILVNSYGYHSIGNVNIRSLKQWSGRKDRFLKSYLADRLEEELNVLNELLPAIRACGKKVWLIALTTKQDLWWKSKDEVFKHYREGEFKKAIDEHLGKKDPLNLRIENVFCSLTIASFKTGTDEVLQLNVEGYDLDTHATSLKRLIEVLEGMRRWENR